MASEPSKLPLATRVPLGFHLSASDDMLWHGVVLRSSPVAARRAPPRQARPHIQAKSTVKKKAFRPSLSPSSPLPIPSPPFPPEQREAEATHLLQTKYEQRHCEIQ
jgi:hypothetical protein